jgi:chromosome segregation ATPase
MEHQLATTTAGEHAALGVAQLSGGQRTLLSLALILAV